MSVPLGNVEKLDLEQEEIFSLLYISSARNGTFSIASDVKLYLAHLLCLLVSWQTKFVVLGHTIPTYEWQQLQTLKLQILKQGEVGDEETLPDLCHLLENHPDPEIRSAAAQAIGMIAEGNRSIDAD